MGFLDTFNRIRLETELQTQDQLARFLGIKQGSVSGAKRRGQFPRAWAEKVGKHFGLRYEWIMDGIEPRRTGTGQETVSFPDASSPLKEELASTLPTGINEKEFDEVLHRLRQILLKADDEDRYKVRGIIDEVYQKIQQIPRANP